MLFLMMGPEQAIDASLEAILERLEQTELRVTAQSRRLGLNLDDTGSTRLDLLSEAGLDRALANLTGINGGA